MPDPVPADLIETIVAAGQRSSTSSNLQTYSVIVVLDADKKKRLAELCGHLCWCHKTGKRNREASIPLYRLRSALI